ncbi:hypothetical protein ACH0DO_002639 [Enterococcus hirae]|nr:hypothetical protein [Enterococcus hirae]
MNEKTLLLNEYKIGWWKKGEEYRYCKGIVWPNEKPMVMYEEKGAAYSNPKLIFPMCDHWFPYAEYLGQ